MRDIVAKHHPKLDDKVVGVALDVFYHLRNIGLERAPTTRELLHWLKYMKQSSSAEAIQKIEKLEGIGALIKTQSDLEKIQKAILRDSDDYNRRSTPN